MRNASQSTAAVILLLLIGVQEADFALGCTDSSILFIGKVVGLKASRQDVSKY